MALTRLGHVNRLLSKREKTLERVATQIHNSATTEQTLQPKISTEERHIVNYDHFINAFSRQRAPSAIRELQKIYGTKGSIPFAGGLPNPSTFPFENITVRLTDGTTFEINGSDLNDSLQYLPTQGYPPLLEKLRDLQWRTHASPNWENSDVIVTPGSQDALSKAIEMSLEPGEPIIVQHPVYSGADSILQPYGADIVEVEQDQDGLQPELLRSALGRRWTTHECFLRDRGVPKLLYINTTGANPTGVALPTERKKEIYQIACDYNLLILEDDPYYFLHFQDKNPDSFLSLDTEGRVLRFDSFSKIMSAGLRLGFATGPKRLIKMIELHLQSTSLHTSSMSQLIVNKTLDIWGPEKLSLHFKNIQNYYKMKRDMMVEAAKKHLTGLAEWNEPSAGMFLWIKIKNIPDVRNLVANECMKRGVLFVTGHAFMLNKSEPCAYLRACYTLPSAAQIDEGLSKLADAIRSEQERFQSLQLRDSVRA